MTKQKCVRVPSDILQALARAPWLEYRARAVLFLLSRAEQEWTCLTLSDWSCGTGISKQNMNRTLKRLLQQNILKRSVVSRDYSKTAKYGFNRHFERWQSYSQETTDHKIVVSGDYCETAKPEQDTEKATPQSYSLETTDAPSLSLSLALAFDSPDTKEEPKNVQEKGTGKKIARGRVSWDSDHWEGVTAELLAFLSGKFPTLDVASEIQKQEAYMVLLGKRYVDGNKAILNWLLHAVQYNKGDEHGRNQRFTVANHTDADYDIEQDVIVADTARPQRLVRPTDAGLHHGTPSGS